MTSEDIAEHRTYAHAHGCAAAVLEQPAGQAAGPALVKIVGPDPICLSFTTEHGQRDAIVEAEDWKWLTDLAAEPGGAKTSAALQDHADGTESTVPITVAPRADRPEEQTLTIGTTVLRLPAGEWKHLLAHQGTYAD
ncbi:hypothetical protein NBH00_23505 [Paraconexibacter antarcticus]|uniref:Uncharacterized protein n=1 Tax=Paraconexibacter antarcticus TaxID=2949664 RepID=A0ABY5DRS7_9ACTN|nr:hypothetical protein [Paraconexibacter antarcticus]UTI64294.1 hypothetical protein NBH00_23505 [Paraconexibacter antarcticus]